MTDDGAESDGSDGSDIDPDEMPGEFSSTAENIEPDELPDEWFSDSAPNSVHSTSAMVRAPPTSLPSRAGPASGTPRVTTPPLGEPDRAARDREEKRDRAVREDSLKAQIDWLVAIESTDPDLPPPPAGAPAEIEISVVVPDGASEGRRLQGQIEVGGKQRTVDVVLPGGVACGDVLQVRTPKHTRVHIKPWAHTLRMLYARAVCAGCERGLYARAVCAGCMRELCARAHQALHALAQFA